MTTAVPTQAEVPEKRPTMTEWDCTVFGNTTVIYFRRRAMAKMSRAQQVTRIKSKFGTLRIGDLVRVKWGGTLYRKDDTKIERTATGRVEKIWDSGRIRCRRLIRGLPRGTAFVGHIDDLME
jgi:hypothetical protein